MVTIGKITFVGIRPVYEIDMLSTDAEPLNPAGVEGRRLTNGSIYLAMDTGLVKKFDEENNKWHKL